MMSRVNTFKCYTTAGWRGDQPQILRTPFGNALEARREGCWKYLLHDAWSKDRCWHVARWDSCMHDACGATIYEVLPFGDHSRAVGPLFLIDDGEKSDYRVGVRLCCYTSGFAGNT